RTVFVRIYKPGEEDGEVWRTDGTPEGTGLAFDLHWPGNLFGFQGSLYFTAASGRDFLTPRGLWRLRPSGGRPELLGIVSQPLGWPVSAPGPDFVPMGGRLFFTGQEREGGGELWVTDGTSAGTRRVRDLRPGPASSEPAGLAAAEGRIYFTARDGEHGRELWVSDGTAEGTRLAVDLNPGGFSSSPTSLTMANGYLFFTADDGMTGSEPWAMPLDP
ncbi:MAG TPA: ELWxxDGT repeat protein, partial [Thermoanaerobaculia bacterium]|nr:ELWxxDGT repeat protein [Thermoanaerobaculia bacterium]